MEAVFVEDWEIYTKQVTDNLITQRLQKNSKDKLATVATQEAHMDIHLESAIDIFPLRYLIKKQTLEETKNIHQELHCLKDSIKTMKQQQKKLNSSNTKKNKTYNDITKMPKGKC